MSRGFGLWQDSIKLTVADFPHPEVVAVLVAQFTMIVNARHATVRRLWDIVLELIVFGVRPQSSVCANPTSHYAVTEAVKMQERDLM